MTIPKKIFYVWGANEPKRIDVELCIKTWKYACPDYEIIEINEDSTEYFNFREELKNNKWFRTVYERKMFAYVSDYVRIKTLYDNGGIYLDTDVIVIKNFDEFLNEPAFVGIQDSKIDGNENYVEPAILGSIKSNSVLKKILEIYDENSKVNIWNTNIYSMPQIFEYILGTLYEKQVYPAKNEQKIIHYKNITIYPEEYFIPYRYVEQFRPKNIKQNTRTIHCWNASWHKPEIDFFLKNKYKYSLEEIDNEYLKYQLNDKYLKNTFIQNIFSIRNSNDKTHKIVTLLGFKIKIRRN